MLQEYQLIENFDPVTYSKFITNSSTSATSTALSSTNTSNSSSLMSSRTGPGLKRMDSVHGRSRELKNFYILSMGHRIQFMQYDDAAVSISYCICVCRGIFCCRRKILLLRSEKWPID